MKKTAKKNTKYSTNETSLKIGYLAKAIAFAMLSFAQKLKMPKTCEKPFYENIRVVMCIKPLKKIPNIREMRRF